MTHVLIVESNSPELLAQAKAHGHPSSADYYGQALQELDGALTYDTVAPYEGATMPETAQYDGVVFTGSGVEWCVDDARGKPLQEAMEHVFQTKVPVYGSCNGMQLAGFVLGGACGASPNGSEDGIAKDVTLTDAGRAHPMMAGRAPRFGVPCVHRDEVQRLPEGAVLLASNNHSPIQAFAYQDDTVDFWGTQYHPEFTAEKVSHYVGLKGNQVLCDDLAQAPNNEGAAKRIGITLHELAVPTRTLELQNWLRHIAQKTNQAAA